MKLIDRIIDFMYTIYKATPLKSIAKPFKSFVYHVYERILYNQIKNGPLPNHVAIIPDGNRRWAHTKGLNVIDGHVHGYERLKEVLKWLFDLGIKVVTIYGMSYENCLYRSEKEKQNLFCLAERGFRELLEEGIVHKYKVKVRVIGNLELLPENVRKLAKLLEHETKQYNERYLNIALCYGGRQEIVNAVKAMVKDVVDGKLRIEDINEETLSKYMSTSHLESLAEPDLVIRTSGEMRISNFLLWQIAYSELYFCDVLWPDFRKIDLLRAIRDFQRRERRFGR